ncbi:MAG: ABC transporter permease [Ignisphaera sp.]|uniref:ABC transporter permease n=1 Tax=Ignisphaera aggregans TaxID=334771 RepID=A0A7C4NLD9_9CREN
MSKRSHYKYFVRFLVKRLIYSLIVLILGLNLLYFIPRLMNINPVDVYLYRVLGGGVGLGAGGSISGVTGTVEAVRKRFMELFGLDKPPLQQYLLYWKRLFTFDFGFSYAEYPKTVTSIVTKALRWTLILVIPVLITGFVAGTYLGLWVALNPSKAKNTLFYSFIILQQTPYYWLAMILIYLLAIAYPVFPLKGAYSEKWLGPTLSFDFIVDFLWHYALPFLSLVIPITGGYAAGIRAAIASEAKSNYVEWCILLGFSRKRISKYVLRAAILPQITWFPLTFVGLLSQSLLVEIVFGYPGIGYYIQLATFSLDYPLMEALFFIIMLIITFGYLFMEILYGLLNPKLGATYVAEEGV